MTEEKTFWDDVDEQAEKSQSALSNFGQLAVTVARRIHWSDDGVLDVTEEIYNALPASDKSLELLFSVTISEFNPDLDWVHERKVRIGDKDWHKALVPSLRAILGNDTMSKGNFSETLQSIDGKYVEVTDVPQASNPEYGTIKFLTIFNSRDEAFAAYSARLGGGEVAEVAVAAPTDSGLPIPPGYGAEAWLGMVADIQTALAGGQAVPIVAKEYEVGIPFIAAIAAL